MDGFHLADVTLTESGLLERKGAPETFDAWGYAALLERVRTGPAYAVYAPGFERSLEQPIAGAITVAPDDRVVLTEGNYLLLDRPEWRAVRQELDEVWFVQTDEALRRQRLLARHVEFGKSEGEARAWVERVDEPNARLVEATRTRADRVIDLSAWRSAAV
jgi:pantothenate kinase